MKKLLLLGCACSFLGQLIFAQTAYYPRDTTYSITSAYYHIQKQYPDVVPVRPNLPKGIEASLNLVYAKLENGRQLHLDILRPKKGKRKKRVAVVMIHGGGWISGSKENLIPMAQQLAKKGYVTITVEYRLGGEATYPAGVHDLKAAIRWLRANADQYGIDSNKIAAYGCSAGAHLASLLGATNGLSLYDKHAMNTSFSADVQAVLNIDGIVSFVHPEAKPEWTGRSANAWLDRYEEHYERWKEASPLTYAGKNTPPILFVNSTYPRFHAGRDDLIRILDQFDIYSETHTLEGSPHSFWLVNPWFTPTLKYANRFLKKIF